MAWRFSLTSLLVAGATLVAAHGCSSSSSGGMTTDAASDALDAGSLFDIYVSDAPHCTIPPKPVGVPDGWELYTDYDPCCLLYAPSSPALLPPPLAWRSCDTAWSGDGGLDDGACRQIDLPAAGAPQFGASLRAGVVTLLTNQLVNGMYAYVVVDADGPVHQAFLQSTDAHCGPSPSDMRDGKYVFQIYDTGSFNGGGFLAGDVTEFRPSFVHHFDDAITHSTLTGALGVLDVDEADQFHLYPWTDAPTLVRNAADDGLHHSFPAFIENALFWSASAGSVDRIASYTADGGAIDFLASADPARGYADIGGDGTDLVWIEGDGHDAGPIGYDTTSWMTSPFTTDPSKLAPRRLRSDVPKGFETSQIKVGCGYAARANGASLRIVHLSDGMSWVLPNNSPWTWVNPLAVTCDEVFVTVGIGSGSTNIARVRLASLGPGIPAD